MQLNRRQKRNQLCHIVRVTRLSGLGRNVVVLPAKQAKMLEVAVATIWVRPASQDLINKRSSRTYQFVIIFENPDVMPHNLVIVQPGARTRVGTAAMTMLPETKDSRGRAYVPETDDVIAATRTLEAGQTESLRVPAIRTEGVYEFVCTFPGHWTLMYGQVVVTNDVDGYLKANPLAAQAPVAEEHHEHGK